MIPLVIEAIYHGLAALALLCVTALFWFAGSTAIAAITGVPNCNGNNACNSVEAAIAFGYFIWAIFTALAVLGVFGFLRSRGHKAGPEAAHPAKPGTAYPGV